MGKEHETAETVHLLTETGIKAVKLLPSHGIAKPCSPALDLNDVGYGQGVPLIGRRFVVPVEFLKDIVRHVGTEVPAKDALVFLRFDSAVRRGVLPVREFHPARVFGDLVDIHARG